MQISDTDAIYQKFTNYYLHGLSKSVPQLKTGKSPSTGFEEDLPNFCRAWELAVAAQNYTLLLESIEGFFLLLISMGRFEEGIELSELARLAAVSTVPHYNTADIIEFIENNK